MKRPATGNGEPGKESELCIVCCEEMSVFAVGPCLHTSVCAECTIRLRCLYGRSECAVCNGSLPMLAVTENPSSLACQRILEGLSDGADAGFRAFAKQGLYCDGDKLYRWWVTISTCLLFTFARCNVPCRSIFFVLIISGSFAAQGHAPAPPIRLPKV